MGTEDNREAENRRERENASRQRYSARQPRSRHGSRRQAGRHEGVPTLEGLGRRLMKITHITAHVLTFVIAGLLSPHLDHSFMFFGFVF